MEVIAGYQLGDIVLHYVAPPGRSGPPGMVLLPAGTTPVCRRENLAAPEVQNLPSKWLPIRAWEVDPLVHVCLSSDPRPGAFAQGRTLRGGCSTAALLMRSHTADQRTEGDTVIRTVLESPSGLEITHEIHWREGRRFLKVHVTAKNAGPGTMMLELLTSFSLGGISPFAADDAPGRLWAHRFRSVWSSEGKLVSERIEDLLLEPSWTAHGVRCERFGAVGSFPVHGWFPTAAIEDREAGVAWGASLVVPGSWQMEFYRRADQLAFSGGLADYEFGHWRKRLAPGESFEAPEAWIAVGKGGPEEVLTRFRDAYGTVAVPPPEADLPVVYNEWSTSWGNPTAENLIALADRLKGSGVRYLVIDDGWAERPQGALFQSNGDWKVNREAFPAGLAATATAIRERGLVPGLWFELEVCNPGSEAWNQTAHLLHRDGKVLEVGNRRFWDFRDPWVHDYLASHVIALLRDCGFGYLKIDYNETIGLGCDGAESLGEELRRHLGGVLRFLDRIRAELPELVIENCSSGGHRHSPAFLTRTSMSSFSDAHETPAIPIIAANLLPLLPPDRCQIWAVLHAGDSVRRLHYSLAAAFLGRMCLSGEIHHLAPAQWALVLRAVALHGTLIETVARGVCERFGERGPSMNHPAGWQAVLFAGKDRIVAVLHTFADPPEAICIPLPEPGWSVEEILCENPGQFEVSDGHLHWKALESFAGAVVSLRLISLNSPSA